MDFSGISRERRTDDCAEIDAGGLDWSSSSKEVTHEYSACDASHGAPALHQELEILAAAGAVSALRAGAGRLSLPQDRALLRDLWCLRCEPQSPVQCRIAAAVFHRQRLRNVDAVAAQHPARSTFAAFRQ